MATKKPSKTNRPPGRPPSELMDRKPDVEFSTGRKLIYLDWIAKEGTYYLGAKAAGVTYATVLNHRAKDPEFARAEQEAKEENTDTLIREAKRRAIEGVSKPLIGGRNKDEVVAYEQVYSDGLLQTLMKSRRSEFGSGGAEGGSGGSSSGRQGGVLIVPQAPHSVTEWHKLYGAKAKGLTHHPDPPKL